MRVRHADGTTVHVSYCSNVHPAEDVDGILAQLDRYAGPVRRAVGAERLGLGLWLPAPAAHVLARDPAAVERLRSALAAQRLEVVTLNGFPYGGFHAPVVKKAVYLPDWTDPARLTYTRDLAHVLAGLLPDDAPAGSISTLPFGWREGWSERSTRAPLAALRRLAGDLAALRDRTGRTIRVGIEPEPGCTIERTSQAVELLSGMASQWVGVCLDACHLAVQFEEASEAVAMLTAAGVPIVKAQVSAALRIPRPRDPAARAELATYVEPRFLHQTRERRPDGRILGVDDLDEALAGGLPAHGEWRTHFHVPVHWSGSGAGTTEASGGVTTTQPQLRQTLAALVGGPRPVVTHLDVETYTWTVLPPDQRPDDAAGLVDGLARELRWTRDRLAELGLHEIRETPDTPDGPDTPDARDTRETRARRDAREAREVPPTPAAPETRGARIIRVIGARRRRSVRQTREAWEVPAVRDAPEAPGPAGPQPPPDARDTAGTGPAPEVPDAAGTQPAPAAPDTAGTRPAPAAPHAAGTRPAPDAPDTAGTRPAVEPSNPVASHPAPEAPSNAEDPDVHVIRIAPYTAGAQPAPAAPTTTPTPNAPEVPDVADVRDVTVGPDGPQRLGRPGPRDARGGAGPEPGSSPPRHERAVKEAP